METESIPEVLTTYLKIIDETINEASYLQSAAVLEQLKTRWIERLEERLSAQSTYETTGTSAWTEPAEERQNEHTESSAVKDDVDKLSKNENIEENNADDTKIDDDDDDWTDSNWQQAESHSTDAITSKEPTSKSQKISQISFPSTQKIETNQNDTTITTAPSETPASSRGVVVTTEEDFYDDKISINEDELSDLEDQEPECFDLVVAQFQSVRRPHTRKAYQKGLWRIKLKHGILQIGGREIIFNTLAGDLTF